MKQAGLWVLIILIALLGLLMFGGEYVFPTMNEPLPHWNPAYGYRFANLPASISNTDSLFFVASFSGGGARASALSYGVLRELAGRERKTKRLPGELDIIYVLSRGTFAGG